VRASTAAGWNNPQTAGARKWILSIPVGSKYTCHPIGRRDVARQADNAVVVEKEDLHLYGSVEPLSAL